MARDYVPASSDRIVAVCASLHGLTACTIACWAKFDTSSPAANQYMLSFPSVSSGNHGIDLYITSAGKVTCAVSDGIGGSSVGVAVITIPDTTNWHFCCVKMSTSGSTVTVTLTVNSSTATDTYTSSSGVGHGSSEINIGRFGTFGGHFDGKIAECAAWNVALSAAEIASLAAKASPLLIRPSALKTYVPVLGYVTDEPNWAGTRLTSYSSTAASQVAHPPIVRIPAAIYAEFAAAAASGVAPRAWHHLRNLHAA